MRRRRWIRGPLLAAWVCALGAPGCQDEDYGQPGVGVEAIELPFPRVVMEIDETIQYEAVALFDNGNERDVTREVDWFSSNIGVASFADDRPGLLVAHTPGEIEVTASLFPVVSEPSIVQVYPLSPVAVDIDGPDEVTIERGETLRLTATVTEADGRLSEPGDDTRWTSSDRLIATVEDGVVTGLRAGRVTVEIWAAGLVDTVTVDVRCALAGDTLALGAPAPALSWPAADDPGYDVPPVLDVEGFTCDPAYVTRPFPSSLVLVAVSADCPKCADFVWRIIRPLQPDLFDPGAVLGLVTLRDAAGAPADGAFAEAYLERLLSAVQPRFLVGDADARLDGMPAPGALGRMIGDAPLPRVWVIRLDDQRVIAESSGLTFLALPEIVADLDADWSDPPLFVPRLGSSCGPEDEEASEPNDSPGDAAALAEGVTEAGLCAEPGVDFFRVDTPGPWRLSVAFDHGFGDIDVGLSDAQTGAPLRGPDGAPLGSFGVDDVEVVEHAGPALVRIFDPFNRGGRYTLTLEAR